MQDLADRLRQQISTEAPLLRKVSDDVASTRPGGGEGWSRKQELGHLLDSATNNRVRFVKAALEGSFDGPSYNPDGWVAMGGYPEASWHELVELWSATNLALASVVDGPQTRAVATGISWASVEVRATCVAPDRPVIVRCASPEKEPVILSVRVFIVDYE